MLSYEYRQFLNEKVLQYLPSKRYVQGSKINFKCPICGDGKHGKHRAWWYNSTASFYCWNQCGGMSGIKFLQYISGQNYEDIKKEYLQLFVKNHDSLSLSASYDVPDKEEPSLFDLKPIVQPEWKQPLSKDARAYLESRLVNRAPFLKDPMYSWTSKNAQEYILIPWTLNGIDAYYQLNDFKRYHTSIKYLFPKDKKKLVYGLDNVDISWPYIILFEGVYDSLFVKNAICTGTKSVSDYQLKLIKERYPRHQICISFDNDQSGIDAMVKLIKRDNDFKFFRWFNENTQEKDVNDYIKKKGDVNIFTDQKKLERMIVDKLVMKIWLIRNGFWQR